jgi:hypothetical protein
MALFQRRMRKFRGGLWDYRSGRETQRGPRFWTLIWPSLQDLLPPFFALDDPLVRTRRVAFWPSFGQPRMSPTLVILLFAALASAQITYALLELYGFRRCPVPGAGCLRVVLLPPLRRPEYSLSGGSCQCAVRHRDGRTAGNPNA